MTNLQLRIRKRERPIPSEVIYAFTPRGNTKIAISVGGKVGNGAFGCVFAASVTKPEDSVIKRALPDEYEADNLSALQNEKRFYDLLGEHENIMGYRATTPRGGLIMPRAPQDIKTAINKIAKIRNPEKRKNAALGIVKEMLNALAYLKEKNCFHNDAHLGNWMIGDDGKVKLIDFGLASEKAAEGLADPEVFRNRTEKERKLFSYHAVKAINGFFKQTETAHFPETLEVKRALRKIFLFDLNQMVLLNSSANKPRNTRTAPPRAFYEENVKLFLSHRDVNDAVKLDSAYDAPQSEDLLNDLYEQRNRKLAKGETLQILRDLLNNKEIF